MRALWQGTDRDDPHGVVGAVRSLLRRPLVVWAIPVTAFAALHTAITVGAAWLRYLDAQAAWPQTQAAVARFDSHAAGLTGADASWVGAWQDLGAPALDLDGWAATQQVLAATAGFAVVLGAALVLAVHSRRALGYVGALVPAISVAAMGGVLGRVSPMIPVDGATDVRQLNLEQYPAALRADRIALDRTFAWADTPVWWNGVVALLVGAIAVVAVRRVLRVATTVAVPAGRPSPVRVALGIGLLAAAVPFVVADESYVAPNLALVTGLTAFVLAAAAACSGVFVALVLALGVVATQAQLAAAFDRASGATGGWGVGTGGAQHTATIGTAVVLVLTPLVAWAVAETWSLVTRHAAAPGGGDRSAGVLAVPGPSS